jgi:hypothetical protein
MCSFSYATVETSTSRSESAITATARTFWNPLRTVDATTGRPYRCGRHRDFLSLVRERMEVRVINLRKAAYKHDSTPHLPLSSERGGEVAQSTIRRWYLFGVQRSSCVPRYRLKRNRSGCPTDSSSSRRRCDRALFRCSRSSSPR